MRERGGGERAGEKEREREREREREIIFFPSSLSAGHIRLPE